MKALVLFSGGIDSTTCLAAAVNKYGSENIYPLGITYGQKHSKELKSAEKIAEYYKTELIRLDLSEMFKYSDCPLLENSGGVIPKESYAEQQINSNGKPVSTYVPFRNGLFLASAASIALSKGCGIIYYGAHSDDNAGNAYPDCSEAFNNAINSAIYEGSGHMVKVEAPFIGMSKSDVVKMGLTLKVPYELTWSCYEGGDLPCGNCGTCIDRIKAFEVNGVKDPVKYNE